MFIIVIHFIPQYGQTHIMAYIGVCSLVGSLSVCVGSFFFLGFISVHAFIFYLDDL